tara:strand:+ start:496 stop:1344 length:849 start_codon:yes stop_codon:yes gene_type:complete
MNAIDSLIEFVLLPLQYPFMIRGIVASVLVGIVCSVIGSYVVLRRMAFYGDALAHSILPGIAIGYLVVGGANDALFWWALVTGIFSSLLIRAISNTTKINRDTAIGVIFAGMFSLGIALISTVKSYSVDLTHFLFGNILGIDNSELWLIAGFSAFVLVVVVGFYRELMVLSFDSVLAETLRLPVRSLDIILSLLIAVTIVVSLQAVGVALTVALLITPAATAYLVTKRLKAMMLIGVTISIFSSVIGLYLSYYLSISSGASIVLSCTGFFLFVWFFQSIRRL